MRIEAEKYVVARMIAIYCRRRHDCRDGLCDGCRELLDYAYGRLSRCPHGDRKPTCRKCTVHCYSPLRRSQIREVMRYAGPRILFFDPVLAFRHIINR